MLSLLTYGATFGVAGAASTRHEFEKLDQRRARNQAIDSGENDLFKKELSKKERFKKELSKDDAIEPASEHQREFQTKQEQHATTGGAIGWLKRLIWSQT